MLHRPNLVDKGEWTCRTLLRESEDHKGLVELVEGTLNTFSSMQDVARRYAAYVHLTSPVPESKLFFSS
jgi:hypothetical protein